MKTFSLLIALVLGFALPAQAALDGRLPATQGGTDYQAYFDTDLNITWLADANINGLNNWDNQVAWAAALTIGGVSGWRLPTTTQPDASCQFQSVNAGFPDQGLGTGCTGSEMGHLFTVEGITAAAPGPFTNVQADKYYSITKYAPAATDNAWVLQFDTGYQTTSNKVHSRAAWPVHDGDVFGSVTVDIDIKPGSDPNSINLCSNGAVPIAILGSSTFDVNDVNTDTLRFAEASVKVVGKKDPHSMCSYTDANGDFITDLVCHFVTTDIAGVDGESTSATLNGELKDGTKIKGTDTVNIVKDTCN